jgi:hypothetical protein
MSSVLGYYKGGYVNALTHVFPEFSSADFSSISPFPTFPSLFFFSSLIISLPLYSSLPLPLFPFPHLFLFLISFVPFLSCPSLLRILLTYKNFTYRITLVGREQQARVFRKLRAFEKIRACNCRKLVFRRPRHTFLAQGSNHAPRKVTFPKSRL